MMLLGMFGSRHQDVDSRNETDTILSAVMPLMKLITLTAIGLVLAHPKTQLVPKSTFKLLSKLVFALFLPCLIFTHLGETITLHNAALWWFIPVNVLISTLIGCMLGYVVALVCRPPPQFFRFTIIMTAFGNTGNLPLAIIGSICHTSDHPFGPLCESQGIAYVSFAQWVAVILVYTLVYHMMEPPLEYYELVSEESEIEELPTSNSLSRPLLIEAEWPGMHDKETEHTRSPFIAQVFNSRFSVSRSAFPDIDSSALEGGAAIVEEERLDSPRSLHCLVEPKVVRKIRIVAEQTPVQHILQPPTLASLLAIIVGFVPFLKNIMFGEEAPLELITGSLDILAVAVVPSVMLILGGMLAEGPNESGLGVRTTVGIIVGRLLVLPLLGIGVVASADKLNLLVHGDYMYKYVLLLQYTTPSAILLGAIASLRGYAVREASAILFWQHVFALLSLSLYNVIYFHLFSSV